MIPRCCFNLGAVWESMQTRPACQSLSKSFFVPRSQSPFREIFKACHPAGLAFTRRFGVAIRSECPLSAINLYMKRRLSFRLKLSSMISAPCFSSCSHSVRRRNLNSLALKVNHFFKFLLNLFSMISTPYFRSARIGKLGEPDPNVNRFVTGQSKKFPPTCAHQGCRQQGKNF